MIFFDQIMHFMCFVQHKGLDALVGCLAISVIVGGRECYSEVHKDEVLCRIPKGLTIPPSGLQAQV